MYSKKTSLLIGFHGCDKAIADAVVNGGVLKPSINDYDWLGHGIYFWEADPVRALEWATELAKRKDSSIKEPAVLGAVIDPGNCLDLSTRGCIELIKNAYAWLESERHFTNQPLPKNANVRGNTDLLLRNLDCAVIETMHDQIRKHPELGIEPFDSVRGIFTEGKEAYAGSGFLEKTHTQICVINPNCIKGYFYPRKLDENYRAP